MRNIGFTFSQPWLLLLLIPAFALTVFLYFRLNKKYRKTRNRIVSIVLHCIVMTLAIFVLAGFKITYQIANSENELILLVDVSDTERESEETRDGFIREVLEESVYDGYKVGVVTFGFDQVYAVPLTFDIDTIYDGYQNAASPDTSATDIAAAIDYTRGLFEHPDTAKIVLITDGKQTDEDANDVIRTVAAQGTRVDTVYVSSEYRNDAVQVVGVEYPDYHVRAGEECELTVSLYCKTALGVQLRLFDNDVQMTCLNENKNTEDNSVFVRLEEGAQSVIFRTVFSEKGLHEVRVELEERTQEGESAKDALDSNNRLCSYFYLEAYDRILVIEQREGDSVRLINMLESDEENAGYTVDLLNLKTSERENIPETVEELRQYDQIILNNISNADLEEYPGLDEILYSYVYDCGGGLFTAGGTDDNGELHAYDPDDMLQTLYQQMLPVQVIDYTPPVGVIVIIDNSGSMGTEEGSNLYWAKQGAVSCLDALTERDFLGVMTADDTYENILPLTSCTHPNEIKESILKIEGGGGTIYSKAIMRAGEILRLEKRVDKRHIVLVSDGLPNSSDADNYLDVADQYYNLNGITLSVIGIGMEPGSAAYNTLDRLAQQGRGRTHTVQHNQLDRLTVEMREDLKVPALKEIEPREFNPVVADENSPLFNGLKDAISDGEGGRQLDAVLGGFYGTKVRADDYLVLSGEYEVPVYASWKLGRGTVGSFMCDFYSEWSEEFMADPVGKTFLLNAIAGVMPMSNIRPSEITLRLREENYINTLSVTYGDREDGDVIEGKIVLMGANGEEEISLNRVTDASASPGCYVVTPLSAETRYSNCSFVIKESGVYKIVITRTTESGETFTSEMYKSFAYSSEYDSRETEEPPADFLAELAEKTEGKTIAVDSPWDVFVGFIPESDRVYDPRMAFIIIAMVLFLLDIAVRKFKFKWLHEIIRERRDRRQTK